MGVALNRRAYFRRPGPLGTASRARSRKEKEDHKTFARDLTRFGPRAGEFDRFAHPPALLVRRALLTSRAGEGATGGVEKEVSIEKCVGTVLPHLRGKGAGKGLKNGPPGVEEGAPGG